MSAAARLNRLERGATAQMVVARWLNEVARFDSLIDYALYEQANFGVPPLIALPQQVQLDYRDFPSKSDRVCREEHERREALFLVHLVIEVQDVLVDRLERAELDIARLTLQVRAARILGPGNTRRSDATTWFTEAEQGEWIKDVESVATELVAVERAWRLLESRFYSTAAVGRRERGWALAMRRRIGVLWSFANLIRDQAARRDALRQVRRNASRQSAIIAAEILEMAIGAAERDSR